MGGHTHSKPVGLGQTEKQSACELSAASIFAHMYTNKRANCLLANKCSLLGYKCQVQFTYC